MDRYTVRDADAAVLRLAFELGVGYMTSNDDLRERARSMNVPVHCFRRWYSKSMGIEVAGYPAEGATLDWLDSNDNDNPVCLSLEKAHGPGYRIKVCYTNNTGEGSLGFPRTLSARDLCTAVAIMTDASRLRREPTPTKR